MNIIVVDRFYKHKLMWTILGIGWAKCGTHSFLQRHYVNAYMSLLCS